MREIWLVFETEEPYEVFAIGDAQAQQIEPADVQFGQAQLILDFVV